MVLLPSILEGGAESERIRQGLATSDKVLGKACLKEDLSISNTSHPPWTLAPLNM
jgi:hypothetical protein